MFSDNYNIKNYHNIIESLSYSKTMAEESTRIIFSDFLSYRLEKEIDYAWDNGQQQNGVVLTNANKAMRKMGDDFEERFRNRFDNMIQQLHITSDTAHETFVAIVHEIFDDGVHWGRIVALFAFAAKFSILCVQKQMPDMVDNVVEWVSAYVDNDLRDWMWTNDKWEGFVRFCNDNSREESSWPNIKTIGGYALAGLGVITLGAFLTQRT